MSDCGGVLPGEVRQNRGLGGFGFGAAGLGPQMPFTPCLSGFPLARCLPVRVDENLQASGAVSPGGVAHEYLAAGRFMAARQGRRREGVPRGLDFSHQASAAVILVRVLVMVLPLAPSGPFT